MNMENKNLDRLSNMPDELLNEIVSFLDMKAVVQASLISQRWRYLWLSTPNLNFSLSNRNSTEKFSRFVNNILRLRDPSKIHQLSLTDHACLPTRLIHSWMSYAVSLHVEQIHLKKLHVGKGRLSNLRVKTLTLSSVFIERPKLQKDIPLNLPVTENLVMSYCHASSVSASFNICAPRLKTLVLDNTHGEQDGVIHIRSPTLTAVKLKGNWYPDFYVEYVSLVTTLDLNVYKMSASFVRGLRKILCKIGKVESLTLSIKYYELWTPLPELQCELKKFRGQFGSVRYLELKNLHEGFSEADLLEIFPNVKTIKRK